ncbi:hypothetical protein L484_026808 [Morus notabilis]|uniref:Uncharacterized protein n=1 Tax=Morus notabilis TaxID=981085 RepID=W9SKW2_9ROSA|nr:hypothetical protein L484_026808 [Morus notabilis]
MKTSRRAVGVGERNITMKEIPKFAMNPYPCVFKEEIPKFGITKPCSFACKGQPYEIAKFVCESPKGANDASTVSQAQVILDSSSVQKQMRSWAKPLAHEGETNPEASGGTNGRDREGAAVLMTDLAKEGKKGNEEATRETRKRVRSRWLKEFVMAEQR